MLRHFPFIIAGASFLLPGFFLKSVLKFWSTRATRMRFRMLSNTLRWTLSFPNIYVAQGIFDKCTLRFGHKDFVFFRKIDLDLGCSMSWNTQPNCFEFINKANGSFSTTSLCLLVRLTVNLMVPNMHFSQNLHLDSVL